MNSNGKLAEILAQYSFERGNLVPILQNVQEVFGYISRDTVGEIANHVNVSCSDIYGVATFYTMFRFKPVGRKHINVCRGTACHVKDADQILDQVQRVLGINEGETSADGEYSLETVACIGCCALAPCMTIAPSALQRGNRSILPVLVMQGARESN